MWICRSCFSCWHHHSAVVQMTVTFWMHMKNDFSLSFLKSYDHWNALCSSENAFFNTKPTVCVHALSVCNKVMSRAKEVNWNGLEGGRRRWCTASIQKHLLIGRLNLMKLHCILEWDKLLRHTMSWFTVECNEVFLQLWALLTLWTFKADFSYSQEFLFNFVHMSR